MDEASEQTLGSRLAGRATNLLAIGVVLILVVPIGRQLVAWYRAPPPTGLGAVTVRPVAGAATPLLRRQVIGSREQASDALATLAAEAVSRIDALPGEPQGADMLRRLEGRTPLLRQSAGGTTRSVYALGERFAGVVGVLEIDGRRTVTHTGVAMPAGDGRYTLLVAPVVQK